MSARIEARFAELAEAGRAAFIPFIMAGDPAAEASLEILRGLPAAGADLIELGVAFTDPMADGPAIQAAGLRALKAGQTLKKTLEMVAAFRREDEATPIILMGYFNPFHAFGVEPFAAEAAAAGVDALIVVDLPPEEDAELRRTAQGAGLAIIRLATPTTDAARLPRVVEDTSGFIYYVSVAGVTGAGRGDAAAVRDAVERVRAASGLPVAVGFGIKTPAEAAEAARSADAVVVGSAIVERIAAAATASDGVGVNAVLKFARDLGESVRGARAGA